MLDQGSGTSDWITKGLLTWKQSLSLQNLTPDKVPREWYTYAAAMASRSLENAVAHTKQG